MRGAWLVQQGANRDLRENRHHRTAHQKSTDARLAEVEAEYRASLPGAQLTRAAYDAPDRAAARYAIFAIASPAEKVAFARIAVAEGDLAAAYALRRALAADQTASDTERTAIHAELEKLTAPVAKAAAAELYALRVEATKALFQNNDPIDPLKMIGAANADAALLNEDGTVKRLTSMEVDELLVVAGAREPASAANNDRWREITAV